MVVLSGVVLTDLLPVPVGALRGEEMVPHHALVLLKNIYLYPVLFQKKQFKVA